MSQSLWRGELYRERRVLQIKLDYAETEINKLKEVNMCVHNMQLTRCLDCVARQQAELFLKKMRCDCACHVATMGCSHCCYNRIGVEKLSVKQGELICKRKIINDAADKLKEVYLSLGMTLDSDKQAFDDLLNSRIKALKFIENK